MSIHLNLLRIFANKERFTDEVLYALGFEIIEIHEVVLICMAGIVISLYFLKASYVEASAAILLIYIHLSSFFCSAYKGAPLASLAIIFLHPVCGSSVTASSRLRNANILVTVIQFMHDVKETHKMLNEMSNENQVAILNLAYVSMVVSVAVIVFSDVSRKIMEDSLAEIAQSNLDRSLRLTKEVLEVVEAKEMFISSILREIKTPLKTINEGIQNLSRLKRNIGETKIVDSIQTSVQILLNMSNNMTDAVVIRSGKLALSCSEMDITDMIKKIMKLNLSKIVEKKLDIKAEIDENVPNYLWTDESRLLQLLTNLMSNALKFVSNAGIVRIKVGWASQDLDPTILLKPMSNPYDELNEIKSRSLHILGTRESSSTRGLILNNDVMNEGSFNEFTGDTKDIHIKNIKDMTLSISDLSSESMKNSRNREGSVNTESELVSSLVQRTLIRGYKRTLDRHCGNLKIQITNSGTGMSQDAISKLFGVPSPVHKSSNSNADRGLGLGLWVCKQICLKMNGDIAVDSKMNAGTNFTLYLPMRSYSSSAEVLPASQNQFRRGMRVLVVDDMAYNRDLLKVLLEREGASVTAASNGAEAVNVVKDKEDGYFTIIMMDIEMPVMNGIDAIKAISQWEQKNNRTDSRVYFVTAGYYHDQEVKLSLKDQGVINAERVGFIRKPLDVDILRRILRECN